MRTSAFLITLAFLTVAGAQAQGRDQGNNSYNDRWLARDKAAHLAVSAALVGFGHHLFRYEQGKPRTSSRNLALGLTLSWGLAKEIRDSGRPGNHFSRKDLVADLLGAGLGTIIFTTK